MWALIAKNIPSTHWNEVIPRQMVSKKYLVNCWGLYTICFCFSFYIHRIVELPCPFCSNIHTKSQFCHVYWLLTSRQEVLVKIPRISVCYTKYPSNVDPPLTYWWRVICCLWKPLLFKIVAVRVASLVGFASVQLYLAE